jgi:hypothetical protein
MSIEVTDEISAGKRHALLKTAPPATVKREWLKPGRAAAEQKVSAA